MDLLGRVCRNCRALRPSPHRPVAGMDGSLDGCPDLSCRSDGTTGWLLATGLHGVTGRTLLTGFKLRWIQSVPEPPAGGVASRIVRRSTEGRLQQVSCPDCGSVS